MSRIVSVLFKFLLGLLGIMLISCTPTLFTINDAFDFHVYFKTFVGLLKDIANPSKWYLSYFNTSMIERGKVSFLEYFKGPYLYSMSVLISSILLSFITALLLAFLTMLSNRTLKKIVLQITKILESFPDFSYVFLIQMVVVQVYLATGYRILSFYSLGGNLVYVAPIVCLSVIPTLLFFKLFLLIYKEELNQPYVELAKSKGLNKVEILIRHCSSNVLKSAFFQSKSIIWLTLSSLVIIEYLFGMKGILYYLRADFSPTGITFILLSVFTPFFIFYSFVENFVYKGNVERNVIFEKYNLPFLHSQQLNSLFKISNKRISLSTFRIRFKRWDIILPILIVFGLLSISFLYNILFHDQIDQINYIYNEDGKLISKAPHPPSKSVFFGTDSYGYSILQQLLVGVKYTILLTLIIATIRIVVGYIMAIVYVFYMNNKSRKVINAIADGMHFLPLTLLVFILLVPVLINSTGVWNTTLTERLVLQVLIMSIIVLPVTTSSIGNEMNETLKKEYVQNSVIMGGSLTWVIWKHINPQLWTKLVLFWTQHIVQVLQMFVHLGILSIFVGGAAYYEDTPYRLKPDISEISGMIAISRDVFVTKQFWMIIPPLLIFMLLIYCFNLIAEGISKKPKKYKRKNTGL
ncbi:ABC transporter permease subunit [Psychrobacillus glaciei]|uniref:ABC transporter permease subunit n=1 Tax=Psychrobacillus glaciei TaxID=2283160 RepID=A0A5J6SPI1_9BACI|nr:ABC transporter permease subunit [Psychrobacillus glaciei]QFF99878.1 ABC transporter permease subunit [Psychrobacillus glaciei]